MPGIWYDCSLELGSTYKRYIYMCTIYYIFSRSLYFIILVNFVFFPYELCDLMLSIPNSISYTVAVFAVVAML